MTFSNQEQLNIALSTEITIDVSKTESETQIPLRLQIIKKTKKTRLELNDQTIKI